MGSQFVDGSADMGSIMGGIVRGLNAAPGTALDNIARAEAIKDARIKRAREEELYNLGLDVRNKLDPAIAPAQATPTTTIGPFVGDINDPAVTTGLPTATFIDPREQTAAEARRALAVAGGKAAIAKDPTNWSSQLAYGNTASAGMPQTAPGRAESEFLATGKWPSHIGRDESKNPLKNWVPVNEKGEPIGQMVTSATSPGPSYVLSSPVSGAQTSALKDQAAAREALARIENERLANGGISSPVKAMEAARLFDVAYPRERVDVDEAGRKVTKRVRKEPIPDWLKQLHEISDDVAKGRHNQPTPAPDAPPIVRTDPNADEVLYKGPANPAELRKEYQATQAVSDWIVTAPLYNSAIKSAQAPTNQGDINIMYAFAKLMDPGSVVRDQEGKLVMNSGTIPESIVGTFNRLVRGGGTMDAQVRLNLIETLKNRMDEIKASKDITDKFYREQVAPAAGLRPEDVLVPLTEPLVYDRNTILQSGVAATAAPTAPTALPAAADRVVGQRYPTPRGPMTWNGTGWVP